MAKFVKLQIPQFKRSIRKGEKYRYLYSDNPEQAMRGCLLISTDENSLNYQGKMICVKEGEYVDMEVMNTCKLYFNPELPRKVGHKDIYFNNYNDAILNSVFYVMNNWSRKIMIPMKFTNRDIELLLDLDDICSKKPDRIYVEFFSLKNFMNNPFMFNNSSYYTKYYIFDKICNRDFYLYHEEEEDFYRFYICIINDSYSHKEDVEIFKRLASASINNFSSIQLEEFKNLKYDPDIMKEKNWEGVSKTTREKFDL